MANMQKNIDLCRATIETVIKNRNLENESRDFFQAQLDLTKDGLPKESTAENDKPRLELFDQQLHRDEDFASKNKQKPLLNLGDLLQEYIEKKGLKFGK